MLLVTSDIVYRLPQSRIFPIVFGEDVVYALGNDGAQCLLEDTGNTQFPLHGAADSHQQFLGESLEKGKVIPNVIGFAAVLLDAVVYLSEEIIRQIVQILQHVLAFAFLSKPQLVVNGLYMESLLEDSQVRKSLEIGDTQPGCHYTLVIYPDEIHKILHSSNLFLVALLGNQFRKYAHFVVIIFDLCKVTLFYPTFIACDEKN